jgi:hypothetical protein
MEVLRKEVLEVLRWEVLSGSNGSFEVGGIVRF